MPFEFMTAVKDFLRSTSPTVQTLLVIAFALLLAVAARYLSILARRLNEAIVTSRAIPLKYVLRDDRRARVINDFVIGLLKYAVYLWSLYLILALAGVQVATYLAALFLVGLAFAFGAQGVVQDLINGFLLRLDGRFNVGDMIEAGGQVGRVEEMQARTTTLRTYLGEKLVIPNRLIEQVGTFPRGYTTAYVDVPVPTNAGDEIKELLRNTARRLHKQFNAVILASPEMLGFVRVGEDELYVRLSLRIWPKENWVVEREFVNRICTVFRARNIPISGDQISVYFRVGTQPTQARTRGRRRLMRRTQ